MRPFSKVPTRSFGPCKSTSTPIGRPVSCSICADQVVALLVILVRAMAEVEPKHIRSGIEQGCG